MARYPVFLIAVLSLGGCGTLGDLPGDGARETQWQAHQQAMAEVDSWDLHARAALTLEGEAYNIGIRWQRDRERFMLLLEAPFGQGVFRIRAGNGGYYRLQLPDGQEFVNTSAEALLEDVIGWSLPISGLEYWIRGLPRPDSNYSHRLDGAGRAREIGQDRWAIDYLDYFSPAPQLPRRIKLAHERLTLKLVIERWQQAKIEDQTDDLFPEFNQ